MIFPTISISESQKSLSKALKNSSLGFSYILSNNKKKGFLGDENFISFIEDAGVLEMFEDWKEYHRLDVQSAIKDGHKIIKSEDFSDTLSFTELCQK